MSFGKKLRRNWRIKLGITVLVLVVFVVGGVCSLLVRDWIEDRRIEHYNLLSRRVVIENPNDIILSFRQLQTDYESYIADNNLESKLSIYFEYLPTGSSIGIRERQESPGASLLKLPLAISFYKLVEDGKISLDTKISLKKEWLNSQFGELYKKGEGYELTYREALEWALRRSDNTAALALFEAVAEGQGTKTPNVMGFVDANYASTPQENILIGTQSYSSILKCLYFSCYLNRDNSQAVLKELIQSEANNRLALYTPNELKVAHKIGTFSTINQSDCGIFYVPKRNYLLCVMVQEPDPEASRVIGDISQMTYEYIAPEEENQQ